MKLADLLVTRFKTHKKACGILNSYVSSNKSWKTNKLQLAHGKKTSKDNLAVLKSFMLKHKTWNIDKTHDKSEMLQQSDCFER